MSARLLCRNEELISYNAPPTLPFVGHLMVIHTASPRAFASTMRSFSRFSQRAEFSTCPTFRFSPTRMQPSVSFAVLPAWMRMP